MSDIKGFVISLIAASAASAVIEGFLPDSDGKNGMKKYLKYLISLAVLLMLLSPLKNLVVAIPSLAQSIPSGNDIFSYESVESMARANSLVALHIGNAVCEKFSLDRSEVMTELYGDRVKITLKKHFGIFERDIREYVAANFGITAEVVFYE